ncbi:hypothetical protein FJ955_10440 [Mesorhizobium sp. B2-2-2]|nr:hypothetical protein FJ955_10440 [Mesorhizobium sp. B2-2-2]
MRQPPAARRVFVAVAQAPANHFVIHGRSKERSDAAQTPGAAPQPKGSMPRLAGAATVRNSAPLRPTSWDGGSATELRARYGLLRP